MKIIDGKLAGVQIDDEDAWLLGTAITWGIANVGYVQGSIRLARVGIEHLGVYLHRVITDAPRGMQVDHINHDPLDNRKCNLRVVTPGENNRNRKGAAANSTTGALGVSRCPKTRRYTAQVQVNGKTHWLGRHDTIAEAAKVVHDMRIKLGCIPSGATT